jgi:hypothetical protein
MLSIAFSSLFGQDAVWEPGDTSPWHQQTGRPPPVKKIEGGGTGATACPVAFLRTARKVSGLVAMDEPETAGQRRVEALTKDDDPLALNGHHHRGRLM